MDELGEMTLSKFRLWSLHALKVYLSHRKRPVHGDFEDFVARAFCAWEENLPVNEQAELEEQRLLKEYKEKLTVEGDIIPDPFSLKTGWKGEKAGMEKWPSIYMIDISKFLNASSPTDITNQLLNEYKLGKAYRYFDCGWVKEVFIHDIRDSSDTCLLKTKVTPSMAVNSKSYDVWALVEKDQPQRPGGNILSAYCTCTAGMLGSCNHVAGLLFCVEHAVKTGETKLSKTSKQSSWNIPKGKRELKSMRASEINWTKGRYGKRSREMEEESRKRNLKKNFTPLTKVQVEQVKEQMKMRNALYQLFRDDAPDSCLALNCEKRRPVEVQNDVHVPPSIIAIAGEVRSKNSVISVEQAIELLTINDDQRHALKCAIVDQSLSSIWVEQRKGQVTASTFQRIVSRVKTLQKDPTADASALVKTILGETSCKPTMAMKHCTSLEPVAKMEYSRIMKKTHKKFEVCDSGLSVCADAPYIAASADLEVDCVCCGKGLCEIKCPKSVKDSVPTVDNVKYLLYDENGRVMLDKKHQYFYQVQGQMAILDRPYCDLFVYTHHGHAMCRIDFDQDFWKGVFESLKWFWVKHVFPSLFLDKENINQTDETPLITYQHQGTPTNSKVRRALLGSPKKKIQPRKQKKSSNHKLQVYLCGVCGLDCINEPKSEADHSVGCDGCGLWVHYHCAGVDDRQLATADRWFCAKCQRK